MIEGMRAMVWFCTACDDQAPWKADERKPCPTCKSEEHVKAAERLPGMVGGLSTP
jgi:hypothetical protein